MTIRRMRPKDVDAAYAIERTCFSLPWEATTFYQEVIENRCARYWVAELEGRVAGYAGMWLSLEEAHITNVAVAPTDRRRGLARALVEQLVQCAADIGMQYVTLECRRSNAAAQALYHQLQFIDVGYRKRYYEDTGEDALVMVRLQMPPSNPEADPDLIWENDAPDGGQNAPNRV